MKNRQSYLNRLADTGLVIEFSNIIVTKIIFPPSISREVIIDATIGLMHTSDYDGHEIETLPDGSVRLTIHLDS